MISRRDKLLNYPWEQQRFEQHREKVRSAKAAVDTHTPRQHGHVQRKLKKVQFERERLQQIEKENLRLLQKLSDIMRTKRINNLWLEPRPNFLNREKLFYTRPYSSLPKIISTYGETRTHEQLQDVMCKKSGGHKPTGTERCPTCRGRPEHTKVLIPEPRLPWTPSRKSWNMKLDKQRAIKRCYHCGYYRKGTTLSEAQA